MLKHIFELKGKNVLITHFADLLKFICKNYFDWDGAKDDEGREILQYVGTDIIRSIKPDYWVDSVKKILSFFPDEWDYVLIPDCRFPGECTRWNDDWDITTVRVIRKNFNSPLTIEQQNHISETALDDWNFDYVIESESGLDNLSIEVCKFVKWMEDMDE